MSSIDNETLLLAIRFGHCSAVHAATLREAGGTWALDALRANEMQRAEVDRLRAIEVAAREYVLETTRGTFESAGKAFFVLGRALAAKDTP